MPSNGLVNVETPPVLKQVEFAIHSVVFDGEEGAASIVDEMVDNIEVAWEWHSALYSINRARWTLKDVVERVMVRELGTDAMRFEDVLVRGVEPDPAFSIKDERAFAEYFDLSAGAMLILDRRRLKMDGIAAFARQKGDDADEIIARFFRRHDTEGPLSLRVCRMEYAPWWCMKPPMRDRERRPRPVVVKR